MSATEPCPQCGDPSVVVSPSVAVCGTHDCDVMVFRIDRPSSPGAAMLRDS